MRESSPTSNKYEIAPSRLRAFPKINLLLWVVLLLESVYFNITLDIFFLLILLFTSVAIGTIVPLEGHIKFIDDFIIRFSFGLGVLGFIVWLSTFYNVSGRSLYVTVSLAFIAFRYPHSARYFKKLRIFFSLETKRNRYLFPVILIFLIFYIMVASYPIWQYDALTKHISIPVRILNSERWDYNVIESVYYGDYAILSHMYFLYLMALGGTKALTIFNVVISFFALFMLLRLARAIHNSNFLVNSTMLIYLSTPFIYVFSTILYVDILPVFFTLTVLLLLKYLDTKIIIQNVYLISFLLGCSLFAKQHAFYLVVPIVSLVLYFVGKAYLSKDVSIISLFKKSAISIFLFLLPFFPAVLIIWYKTGNPVFPFMNGLFKSIYYSQTDFVDPFHSHPLGFNISSLLSIVFHTNMNTEFSDGGFGFYLLLLFLLPLVIFLKRNRFFIVLAGLFLFSYYISTLLTYNIRYMLGSLILGLLVCVSIPFYLIEIIKNVKLRNTLVSIVIMLLFIPNMVFIFTDHYWTFKKKMLRPNGSLTINQNESVLSLINEKSVKVLSNNDVFRGTFKGDFYTLTWMNDFFVRKLNGNEFTPQQFLQSFDYYLVDKRIPQTPYVPQNLFSLANPHIKTMLTLIKESDSHLLFKVEKKDRVLLLAESFPTPLLVNVERSLLRVIQNTSQKYRIEIEAERIEDGNDSIGRFQINWHDKKDNLVHVSLIPFVLNERKGFYLSPWIENIPEEAKTGILYLTSHNKKEILIHSFKVMVNPEDIVKKYLDVYSQKWPRLRTP